LEDRRYLAQASSRVLPGQKLLNLTRRGFNQFVAEGDEKIVELKSESVRHDLALVDIRKCLSAASKIEEFLTENELQTWRRDDELQIYTDYRCDAVVKARFSGELIPFALEYEDAPKAKSRINANIRKYYDDPDISAVLWVCSDEKTQARMIDHEKESCMGEIPKFYYATFSQLLDMNELLFSSRENRCLSFG